MTEDGIAQESQGTEEVKTCPHCRGIWPAERTHCLACGASLADVLAGPPLEDPHGGPINWRVLDALSLDQGEGEASDEAPEAKERKGRWWEFWR